MPLLQRIIQNARATKTKKIFLSYDEWRNNLGDVFNDTLMRYLGVPYIKSTYKRANLIAVGSTLQNITVTRNPFWKKKRPIHIWGTGFIRPPIGPEFFLRPVEVHAVRGTITRARCEYILGKPLKNIALGDPGLLMSRVIPISPTKRYDVGIIPHYLEKNSPLLDHIRLEHKSLAFIDIQSGVETAVRKICECRFVLSSALHGLIVADSYGIPNRHIKLGGKLDGGDYKFKDYYSVFGISNPKTEDLSFKTVTDADIDAWTREYSITPDAVREKCDALLDAFPFKTPYANV